MRLTGEIELALDSYDLKSYLNKMDKHMNELVLLIRKDLNEI